MPARGLVLATWVGHLGAGAGLVLLATCAAAWVPMHGLGAAGYLVARGCCCLLGCPGRVVGELDWVFGFGAIWMPARLVEGSMEDPTERDS